MASPPAILLNSYFQRFPLVVKQTVKKQFVLSVWNLPLLNTPSAVSLFFSAHPQSVRHFIPFSHFPFTFIPVLNYIFLWECPQFPSMNSDFVVSCLGWAEQHCTQCPRVCIIGCKRVYTGVSTEILLHPDARAWVFFFFALFVLL